MTRGAGKAAAVPATLAELSVGDSALIRVTVTSAHEVAPLIRPELDGDLGIAHCIDGRALVSDVRRRQSGATAVTSETDPTLGGGR